MKCPNCKSEVKLDPGDLQTIDLNNGQRGHYLICKTCSCLLKEDTHFVVMVLEIEVEQ